MRATLASNSRLWELLYVARRQLEQGDHEWLTRQLLPHERGAGSHAKHLLISTSRFGPRLGLDKNVPLTLMYDQVHRLHGAVSLSLFPFSAAHPQFPS